MDAQRLADLGADAVDRRQRTHRLLEDHGDLLAAHAADVLAARIELGEIGRGAVGAVSTIEPPSMRPGRSTICRIERAVTDLPEPDSPTTQSVLPRCSSKETPSTALNEARARREIGLEILDLEDRVVGHAHDTDS